MSILEDLEEFKDKEMLWESLHYEKDSNSTASDEAPHLRSYLGLDDQFDKITLETPIPIL